MSRREHVARFDGPPVHRKMRPHATECINCHEPSAERLCKACRESSPFSESELDVFLGLVDVHAPREE